MKKIKRKMNEGGGTGVEFVFDPNSRTGRNLRAEADLTGEGGLKISVANLPIASYENSAVATDGGYIQFDEAKVKEAVVKDYNEYERTEDEPEISVDDIEKIVEVNPNKIPNLMYSAGWTRATLSTDDILTWDKYNKNGYLPGVEVIFILNGEEKNLIVTVDGEYHPSAEAVEVYNTIDDIADEEDYDENYKGKKVMKKSVNENDRLSEIWNYLVDTGVATEEELQLVTDINGYTEEALNDVIYARTGYHDLEQLKGEDEDEEDYDENYKGKKVMKKSVNENLRLITDFSDYKPWSGAIDTYERIEDAGLLDQLEMELEDAYPEGMTITELNDLLWFDSETIYGWLGLNPEEDEEDYDENYKGKKVMKKSVNEISAETAKKATEARKQRMTDLGSKYGREMVRDYRSLHDRRVKLSNLSKKDLEMLGNKWHDSERKYLKDKNILDKKMANKSESLSSSILKEAHSVLSMNENESGEMTTWQFTARGFSKAMVNKQPVFGSADVRCIIHENADGKVVGTAVVAYYMNEAQVEEAIKKALAENGFKTSNITELVNLY